ncbi:hypothetical protein CRG98_050186, partial [Punica granatum]
MVGADVANIPLKLRLSGLRAHWGIVEVATDWAIHAPNKKKKKRWIRRRREGSIFCSAAITYSVKSLATTEVVSNLNGEDGGSSEVSISSSSSLTSL